MFHKKVISTKSGERLGHQCSLGYFTSAYGCIGVRTCMRDNALIAVVKVKG